MKITEDVYLVSAKKGAGGAVYAVLGDTVTLIDTGMPGGAGKILRELKKIGVQPGQVKDILLTHYDIDHVGNCARLQKLTGAELWASEKDLPVIQGTADRQGFKKYLKYIFPVEKPQHICALSPGKSINGLEVIETPGHTPGHLCFLYKDILFAGDLLENKKGSLAPYPEGWNWDNELMMQSVAKVARIPFRLVCPGHGELMEKGNGLEGFRG